MNRAEDISLVSQIILFRSEKAFRQLVDKYQVALRKFFLNLTCGDVELSNDLAQETFIKVWSKIDKFKGLASFKTWLYKMAYNIYYDRVRSVKHYEDIESPEVSEKLSENDEKSFEYENLYIALGRLKDEERMCITLFYLEDFSIKKIAGITGLSDGTIKSHLSRGRNHLKEFLTTYEINHSSSPKNAFLVTC